MTFNVLGISGLPTAWDFKAKQWPELDKREYRIVQGQDAAASLVMDGEIIAAAAEERFNGKKHTSDFPVAAIQYCLDEAGLKLGDIDEISHCFDYRPYRTLLSLNEISARRYEQVYAPEVIKKHFQENFEGLSPDTRFTNIEHHLAHAASAYHTSGWDTCLTIVSDGMGELDATSIWQAKNGKLEKLHSITAKNSIGIFYSIFTLHLGFEFNNDEYKVMGLAPYGDPERYRSFFDEAVQFRENGSLHIPLLHLNKTAEELETYSRSRQYIAKNLIAPRVPGGHLSQDHKDVAAALQECLNRTMSSICEHFSKLTGMTRLAMAGGVALNCSANRKLRESEILRSVYIQPAAGDDGASLGAALASASQHVKIPKTRMPSAYLGPKSEKNTVEALLAGRTADVDYRAFQSFDEQCQVAARLISEGSIIAWHRGRMEFGPRALGNRSILADPSRPDMQDRINALIKKRESFRPFAPAVTLDQAHKWFNIEEGTELPYMLFTVQVRDEHQMELPAITHVDGSARIQTVSADSNRDFYLLLKKVGELTGREIVLNTSFNIQGQPIVNTAKEAVATLITSGIDALFLESCMVTLKSPASNLE